MNSQQIRIPAGDTVSSTGNVPIASNNFIAIETPSNFTACDLAVSVIGTEEPTAKPLIGLDGNQVTLAGAVADSIYVLDHGTFFGINGVVFTASVAQVELTTIYLYYK